MSATEVCGFQGNPDIYGIGIRIGFYTQALAAWYANYFLASEARGLRSVNLIFLFALTVCLLVYSGTPDQRQAAEVFCMLEFGLVMGFVSVGDSQTRYSTRYLPTNPRQIIVYHLLCIAAIGFSTWFWWTGLDLLLPTNCGTYIWFFVKVDLYGGVRTWMKVGHIISLCNLSVMLWSAFTRIQQHERFRSVRAAFTDYVRTQEQGLTDRIQKEAHATVLTSTSTGSVATSTHSDTEKVGHDVAFESILEAEEYLDDMVGVYAKPKKERQTVKPDPRYDTSILRALQALIMDNIFVWITAIRWSMNSREGKSMLDLNNAIAKHANGLRINAQLYRPRIFRRMVEEEKPTVSWQTLCLASDIQQSQLPLYSNTTWCFRATQNLLLVIWIIVQIELTICWNDIQGLLEPFSFGQLLALVLGIAGLFKVIWQKVWNRIHGKSEEDFRPEGTSYEEAFRVYLRWKQRSVKASLIIANKSGREIVQVEEVESPSTSLSKLDSKRHSW